MTFTQDALLADMRNRLSLAPSMNEISKHVAFWPEEKALNFFIAVSEVLELKQRRQRESVGTNVKLILDEAVRMKFEGRAQDNTGIQLNNFDLT